MYFIIRFLFYVLTLQGWVDGFFGDDVRLSDIQLTDKA